MLARRGRSEYVQAERFHHVQPLDLDESSQQVRDAVASCADAVEELHAVRHASDFVAFQSEALGQVTPRPD